MELGFPNQQELAFPIGQAVAIELLSLLLINNQGNKLSGSGSKQSIDAVEPVVFAIFGSIVNHGQSQLGFVLAVPKFNN